jgi:hypothetical protein
MYKLLGYGLAFEEGWVQELIFVELFGSGRSFHELLQPLKHDSRSRSYLRTARLSFTSSEVSE